MLLFPTFKSHHRVSHLIRFSRHKFLRKYLNTSKKKVILLSGTNFNKNTRTFFLKNHKLKYYQVTTPNNGPLHLKKKKYRVGSYIFKIICKLPRKYKQELVGRQVLLKYSTMPLKPTMTRYTLHKILRGYYQNLSTKALYNLSRHKSVSTFQTTNTDSFSPIFSSTRSKLLVEKKQTAKNFIQQIENRLDNSLLRLLNFKSLYTLKRFQYSHNHFSSAKKKYPKTLVKSPLLLYSAIQTKQLLAHGKILVNNKPVFAPSSLQKLAMPIQIKGFISPASSANATSDLVSLHNNTLLLRKFKDKNYLSSMTEATPSASEVNLIHFIKSLRVKRFTELFYLTYRNMHLVDRISDTSSNDSFHIEKHINPLFTSLTGTQSVFTLWPLLSLLKTSTFSFKHKTSFVRQNLVQYSALASANDKRNVQILLRYQKYILSGIKNDQLKNCTTIPEKSMEIENAGPKCYAAILYGTRSCKWVRFQQNIQSSFHNHFYNKLNFFEWELTLFQQILTHYKP